MTTDLEKAEQTVADLEGKRTTLIRQGTDLQDERSNVALAAHTGDKKARARLDAINISLTTHTSELTSIDAALKVAAEHVVIAERAEAREAAKANAKQVRKLLESFAAAAHDADDALADFAVAAAAMRNSLSKVHSLGCGSPTHMQLLSLGRYCLLTALGGTMWAREFEVISPSMRRSFGDTVATWCENLDRNNLAPLLGEPPKEKEAA